MAAIDMIPALGRRSLPGLLAVICLASATPVWAASGWDWNWFGNPTTTWSPEAVADYMLTGQTPHPAVARIVAPESDGTSMGSGVLVDVNESQGLILTNWHVVRDSRAAVLVQFSDGFQSAGTVVRWDADWDLAAIVVWRPHAEPVVIAAQPPVPGELLTIAGFGRGSYREETGPCTDYLSPGAGHPKEFVELKATARQGDSGGPIFNERRELAGLLFGQNDGRTIGSCSVRLRTFLATLGSAGFDPSRRSEFVAVASASPPTHLTAAAVGGTQERSTHVPDAVTDVAALPPPPLPALSAAQAQAPASGDSPDLRRLMPLVMDGTSLLTAAGGLALVVLGLKTMFGGRRPPPA